MGQPAPSSRPRPSATTGPTRCGRGRSADSTPRLASEPAASAAARRPGSARGEGKAAGATARVLAVGTGGTAASVPAHLGSKGRARGGTVGGKYKKDPAVHSARTLKLRPEDCAGTGAKGFRSAETRCEPQALRASCSASPLAVLPAPQRRKELEVLHQCFSRAWAASSRERPRAPPRSRKIAGRQTGLGAQGWGWEGGQLPRHHGCPPTRGTGHSPAPARFNRSHGSREEALRTQNGLSALETGPWALTFPV